MRKRRWFGVGGRWESGGGNWEEEEETWGVTQVFISLNAGINYIHSNWVLVSSFAQRKKKEQCDHDATCQFERGMELRSEKTLLITYNNRALSE